MIAMAKQKLAPYRAKRDFKKTGEPAGKLAIAAADYPRFIIQNTMPAVSTTTYALKSMAFSNLGR